MPLAQISSKGRVRSQTGCVTQGSLNPNGYNHVGLYGSGTFQVHCLVAFFFGLRREPGQKTVDHINGDRTDNRIENLRYANASEQAKNQKRPSKHKTGKTANENYVLEGEKWAKVEGGNGHQVSNLGRWRTAKNPDRSFTPISNREDKRIQMNIGEGKKILLYRAVGLSFVERPEGWTPEWTIDHLAKADGVADVLDNRACSLEWVEHGENVRRAKKDPNRKSNVESRSKPVEGRKITSSDSNEWIRFECARHAWRETGIHKGSISNAANGKRKTAEGWVWRYAERKENEDLEGEEWRDITQSGLKIIRDIASGEFDKTENKTNKKRKLEEVEV